MNRKAYYGAFGGQYVAESLMNTLEELDAAFEEAIRDPEFLEQYHYYLKQYVGRETPLYYAERLSEKYGMKIYLKREDLNHTARGLQQKKYRGKYAGARGAYCDQKGEQKDRRLAAGRLHDVCHIRAMPDVCGSHCTEPHEKGGDRQHEPEGGVRRVGAEPASDGTVQPSGRDRERRAGRGMFDDALRLLPGTAR